MASSLGARLFPLGALTRARVLERSHHSAGSSQSCPGAHCPAAPLQVAVHPGHTLCGSESDFCSDCPGGGHPMRSAGRPSAPTAVSRPLLCGRFQRALDPRHIQTPVTGRNPTGGSAPKTRCCEGPAGYCREEGMRALPPRDRGKREVPGSSWQKSSCPCAPAPPQAALLPPGHRPPAAAWLYAA